MKTSNSINRIESIKSHAQARRLERYSMNLLDIFFLLLFILFVFFWCVLYISQMVLSFMTTSASYHNANASFMLRIVRSDFFVICICLCWFFSAVCLRVFLCPFLCKRFTSIEIDTINRKIFRILFIFIFLRFNFMQFSTLHLTFFSLLLRYFCVRREHSMGTFIYTFLAVRLISIE